MGKMMFRFFIVSLLLIFLLSPAVNSKCLMNLPLGQEYENTIIAGAMFDYSVVPHLEKALSEDAAFDMSIISNGLTKSQKERISAQNKRVEAKNLKLTRKDIINSILSEVSARSVLERLPSEKQDLVMRYYISEHFRLKLNQEERSALIYKVMAESKDPKSVERDFRDRVNENAYSSSETRRLTEENSKNSVKSSGEYQEMSRNDLVFTDMLDSGYDFKLYETFFGKYNDILSLVTEREIEFFLNNIPNDKKDDLVEEIEVKYQKDIVMGVFENMYPEMPKEDRESLFDDMKPTLDVVSSKVESHFKTIEKERFSSKEKLTPQAYALLESKLGKFEWKGLSHKQYAELILRIGLFMNNQKSYLINNIYPDSGHKLKEELSEDMGARKLCNGAADCDIMLNGLELPSIITEDFNDPTTYSTDLLFESLIIDLERLQGQNSIDQEVEFWNSLEGKGSEVTKDVYLEDGIRRLLTDIEELEFEKGFVGKGRISGLSKGELFSLAGANLWNSEKGDLVETIPPSVKRLLRETLRMHKVKVEIIKDLGIEGNDAKYVYSKRQDLVKSASLDFFSENVAAQTSMDADYIRGNIEDLDSFKSASYSDAQKIIKILRHHRFNNNYDHKLKDIMAKKALSELGLTETQIDKLLMIMQMGTKSITVIESDQGASSSKVVMDNSIDTKSDFLKATKEEKREALEESSFARKISLEVSTQNMVSSIRKIQTETRLAQHFLDIYIDNQELSSNKKALNALVDFHMGDQSSEDVKHTLAALEREGLSYDDAILAIGRSYNLKTGLKDAVSRNYISQDLVDQIVDKYRGHRLENHIARVTFLADMMISEGLISERQGAKLKTAILLHDIGKFGPDMNHPLSDDIVKLYELAGHHPKDMLSEVLKKNLHERYDAEVAEKKYGDMIAYFREIGLLSDKNPDKEMRVVFGIHASWTAKNNNRYFKSVDPEVRMIAEEHHHAFLGIAEKSEKKRKKSEALYLDRILKDKEVTLLINALAWIDTYEAYTSRTYTDINKNKGIDIYGERVIDSRNSASEGIKFMINPEIKDVNFILRTHAESKVDLETIISEDDFDSLYGKLVNIFPSLSRSEAKVLLPILLGGKNIDFFDSQNMFFDLFGIRYDDVHSVDKQVGELDEILGKVENKEKTLDNILNDVTEKIGETYTPDEVIVDLMKLYYESPNRIDSPTGNYFDPEMVDSIIDNTELSDKKKKIRKEINRKMYDRINRKMQAVEGDYFELYSALLGMGYKSESITIGRALKNSDIQKILKNFETGDQNLQLNKGKIIDLFVLLKNNLDRNDLSSTKLNEFFDEEGNIKEEMIDSIHALELDARLELGKIITEEVGAAFEILHSQKKEFQEKYNEKSDYYEDVLSDLIESDNYQTDQILSMMLTVLKLEHGLDFENSLGRDSKKLYENLKGFREGMNDYLASINSPDARIVSLLGDGEPFYLFERLNGNDNVDLAYVSRMSLMAQNEFADYLQLIEGQPGLKSVGTLLDEKLLYSTLYKKSPKGETKDLGIFAEAAQEADLFAMDLIKKRLVDEGYQLTNKITKKKSRHELVRLILNDKKFSTAFSENNWKEIEISTGIRMQEIFTDKLRDKIAEDPKIAEVVDMVYAHIENKIGDGDVVFVDTGAKGTLPMLLAAITNIKTGKEIASMYLYAIGDPLKYGVVPHYTETRSEVKTVEDSGKFTEFGGKDESGMPLAVRASPSSRIMAAIDLHYWANMEKKETTLLN